MPRYRVLVARLCASGFHRAEVTNWIIELVVASLTQPKLIELLDNDILHVPIQQCGTDVARNRIVKVARERKADLVFMVDDDMRPPVGWFQAAVEFLTNHQGPAVLGCPYVCAPPREEVQVFDWGGDESGTAGHPWGIEHVGRNDACRRKGIERCDQIGTGCIAYRTDAFERIPAPWYAYTYNEDHTAHVETEDCYCHRHLAQAGVPLYCHWDFWAGHWKGKWCEKPQRIEQKDIDRAYLEAARAELRQEVRAEFQMPEPEPEKPNLGMPTLADREKETPAQCWAREAMEVHDRPEYDPRTEPFLPHRAAMWASSVEGWMHPAELLWLARSASQLKSGDEWVEVGTWKGRSLAAAFLAARPGVKFCAVDTFHGSEEHRKAGLDCRTLREDFLKTRDALFQLRPNCDGLPALAIGSPDAAHFFRDASLAVVFLDAAHDLDSVRADLKAWLPKLRPGGLLCGHDRNEPGVRQALEEVLGAGVWRQGPDSLWYVRLPEGPADGHADPRQPD